jgi:DNA-binding NtrC family response regulator
LGRRASGDDGRKVLVVDDDADWREFLRLCLEDLGYETIEAATGQEVLERMPRSGPQPRVVFLTSAAAQDVGGALRTGPHYYLPKGASRDQLSLLLQSLEH